VGLARLKGMANIIGELLFAIGRALIVDWAYSLFIKVGTWLDTKIAGRTAKVVIGMLLGLAAYILIPVFAGLLGF
jgi:uncharacterized membrane protein SirB2